MEPFSRRRHFISIMLSISTKSWPSFYWRNDFLNKIKWPSFLVDRVNGIIGLNGIVVPPSTEELHDSKMTWVCMSFVSGIGWKTEGLNQYISNIFSSTKFSAPSTRYISQLVKQEHVGTLMLPVSVFPALVTYLCLILAPSLFVQGGPDSWLGPGRAAAREVKPGLARGPVGPRPSLDTSIV